jgi:uncharacterized membrane protein YkvI
MLKGLREKEINIELVAVLIFIVISALYILSKFGLEQLLDTLFLWMFPASIMIFLTLLIVKIIEKPIKYQENPKKSSM